MEKRFTGILLPILIGLAVWLLVFEGGGKKGNANAPTGAQQRVADRDPGVQAQIAKQPQHQFQDVPEVVHTFGELGQDGFRVAWSRYGAGVRNITMNDHFVATREKGVPVTDWKECYPLVPYYPGATTREFYGLVLEGAGAHRFAKAIDAGPKNQLWDLVKQPSPGDLEVRFRLDLGDGLRLEKVFRYQRGARDLGVDIELHSDRARPDGAPVEYRVGLRNVHLWNPTEEHLFVNPAMAVGATRAADGSLAMVQPVDAEKATGADFLTVPDGAVFEFAGTTSRFFGGFLFAGDPATAQSVKGVACRNWPAAPYETGKFHFKPHSVPVAVCELTLPVPSVGQKTVRSFRLYLGPKSDAVFDRSPDYQRFHAVMDQALNKSSCCCVPGLSVLAKALIWVLSMFQRLVSNWGVAIILLTLTVRIALSPINFNMQRTMRVHGAKMAELKPQLDAINQRYKDDPKQLQVEMMRFNKEHKLLTAPLKGCLPMFLTMPIWFGLFTALREMYELRAQPFFGYIRDLSRPDALIPFDQPLNLVVTSITSFNLLPILMIGLWLYLQMGTPLPKDPQQRQMMVMMRFMPIMMGVMLYNYAAGLMIYMCTSSVWGIVEQKVTKKVLGPPPTEGLGASAMPVM
ncbi:MAG: membrane protein insertase YidC [Planctomycetes bacterium]|nr:membrane protein insertase YidC [Planctomycetota bacterium]